MKFDLICIDHYFQLNIIKYLNEMKVNWNLKHKLNIMKQNYVKILLNGVLNRHNEHTNSEN